MKICILKQGAGQFLKMSWDEWICHLCDNKKVVDENRSLRMFYVHPH